MKKEKISWAWRDEDGVYVNIADSFYQIVDEIFTYYFDFDEEGDNKFTVTMEDGKQYASFHINEIQYPKMCFHERWETVEVLEWLANLDGRPDRFDITIVS